MRTLRFVWIDDQKQKVESYRAAIEAGIGSPAVKAKIELIEVKKELLATLDSWRRANTDCPPHLFIIDHVFNTALPFDLKGSSVAHLLRNEFPRVPMVCVTAKLDSPNAFDQEDLSEYTALFLYTRLEENVEDLYIIARDFPKLTPRDKSRGIREHLVECLAAPRRDRNDLLRILPDEFQNQRHLTTEHRMARWIYTQFLACAGFLYDRLHAATLLGLNETGFEKVEHLFAKALYKGVFALSRRRQWWTSELHRLLFSLNPDGPDLPQLAGRQLPGINEEDHSVCYVSKKSVPPPDAVVLADATRDPAYRVVSRQFSAQHPSEVGITPGFEARLILATKKK